MRNDLYTLSLATVALCVFSAGSTAQSPAAHKVESPSAIAARRSQMLNRGVNLSGWYGGWGEYTTDHLSTWTTPADFAFIHASGLSYVRLCVDPVQLSTGGYDSPASVAMLARLDTSIDQILASGLSLSVTAFPRSDYKRALLTPEGAQTFRDFWKFMAAHLASRDPERVFYDILNEPEIEDPLAWSKIQQFVVDDIRMIDTRHTLIASANRYDGIDELLLLPPLREQNILYTFHFYEPFPFTHQGATWSTPAFALLHNVPYPAAPEKLGPMIASATDPAARDQLTTYSDQAWDETTILNRLKKARAWADLHHVTIIANEFGAFRDTIAPAQRAVYLHDVRSSMEALHIPWAEWDYRGNFGIVSKQVDGTIVPDIPVMQALGLTIPTSIPASETPVTAVPFKLNTGAIAPTPSATN